MAAAPASKASGLRWLLRYVRPCSYLCGSVPSLPRSTSTSVRPVPERQDSKISWPPSPAASAAATAIEATRQVVHLDVAGSRDPNKLPKESGNQDKHHKQQIDQAPAPVPPAGIHRGSAAAMPAESRAADAVLETIGAIEDKNKRTK